MRIGASLFLIAVGAILKFAVTHAVSGVNIGVIGIILMIVGGVGLLLELIMWATRRDATVVTHTHVPGTTTYVEPTDRIERY